MHGSYRRFHHCARSVAKIFTRLEIGFFANNAFASDFLYFAIAIGNDPVTCEQLGRNTTIVFYRYSIGKNIVVVAGVGLLCNVGRLNIDNNIIDFLRHLRAPPACRQYTICGMDRSSIESSSVYYSCRNRAM